MKELKENESLCPWRAKQMKRESRKLSRRLRKQYLRYDMGLLRGTDKTELAKNLERERELAAVFVTLIKHGEILTEWDWTLAVMELYMGGGAKADGAD